MKKTIAIVLALVLALSMTACGGSAEPKKADLAALYETMTATLPMMLPMDETTMMNFLGIDAADCVQAAVAICAEGLRADEVWLIEARDADALSRIQTLAENRLKAKADETVSYNPEQYAVVEKGQLFTEGNYLFLLVSPDVDTLKAAVDAAWQ
jgi:Flp pilus assembly protein TadD